MIAKETRIRVRISSLEIAKEDPRHSFFCFALITGKTGNTFQQKTQRLGYRSKIVTDLKSKRRSLK